MDEFLVGTMINYYLRHGRRYSWRNNRTPYQVYLSEMLLQRTKADQVEPVFNQLLATYPDLESLRVGFEEARVTMQPLGRFCRFKHFKSGLDYLITNCQGEIPADRGELLKIPGIGPYIAAAIRIFGFSLKDTLVDSNVVRFFCRFYGLEANPEIRRKKSFLELVSKHTPDEFYVEYAYGLLDFAAEICRPIRPNCNMCQLRNRCHFVMAQEGLSDGDG
jgi:A/G-specific adenine glycosylase